MILSPLLLSTSWAESSRFPSICGLDLDGQEVCFPQAFAQYPALILTAFAREQHGSVESWIPWIRQQQEAHPTWKFFRLPVLPSMPILAQGWIRQGMSGAVTDPWMRTRLVTLHTSQTRWAERMGVRGIDEPALLLVDPQAQVHPLARGRMNEEKRYQAEQLLQQILPPDP